MCLVVLNTVVLGVSKVCGGGSGCYLGNWITSIYSEKARKSNKVN